MSSDSSPYFYCKATEAVVLTSPTAMPKASGFLWNKKMMLQMNCRGYAVAQFMQPEPTKYSSGPALEATTFMQPEHHYYSHHPGRFFYIKSHCENTLFSLPFEPVKQPASQFEFQIHETALIWTIRYSMLLFTIKVELVPDEGVEHWTLEVENLGDSEHEIDIYPYFSVGFLSWMNQSADFNERINGIVANKVTPYQKLGDYFRNKHLKENTFLVSDSPVSSFCANASEFEGLGGLHAPDAINSATLGNAVAKYEVPIAVLQHKTRLFPQQRRTFQYLFGAASGIDEVTKLKQRYFSKNGAAHIRRENTTSRENIRYSKLPSPALEIDTPDIEFDRFVNKWLPRQLFYHGDVNRLTTDPQTRNYLQDAMGMVFISHETTKTAIKTALFQQNSDGSMPDGVLLHPDAELKYINQVPHSDHCVWLPICLHSYLHETADIALLHTVLPFADSEEKVSVAEHVERAMLWLEANLDERGLSLIHQGDWCDPMNMVGYKGKGVSAWLSMATSYAWQQWAQICDWLSWHTQAKYWRSAASQMNNRIQQAFFYGDWYGRGITDDGRLFGIAKDKQGAMFLNPQSWAMLSGALEKNKAPALIQHIQNHLYTPFGPVMLAPAFTEMVEDIGRVTQKYPGSAENGSVYNHAAAFYAFSLYQYGFADEGFRILSQMLVNKEDALKRGQLPVFIPNYYRGAWKEHPEHAGRSSQLFNTGTVAWFYRTLVEQTFGLMGTQKGLKINPKLPTEWQKANVKRRFRGAKFNVNIEKSSSVNCIQVWVDKAEIQGNEITNIAAGKTYNINVKVAK